MIIGLLLLTANLYCTEAVVTPFEIKVDQEKIRTLHRKLDDIIWPTVLEDFQKSEWSYGVPLDVMKDLTNYLRNDYNFAEEVQKLNKFPQFIATVDGFDVHYIHQKSSHADAKPLMLVHGWPGSFMECIKIIPMLTEPQMYGGNSSHAFHVVCPSIPGNLTTCDNCYVDEIKADIYWTVVLKGYGFSSAPVKSSFDQQRCAEIFRSLMISKLNYEEFYLQGGDWGSVVTSLMASLPNSQNHVLGLHLNMIPAMPPINKGFWKLANFFVSLVLPWFYYSPLERDGMLNLPWKMFMETGYFHEQSTRPMTLAYGLSDSPVGLMSWIIEKFYAWSDCNGDLFSRFTRDELLTNFMIYWMTNSGASSVKFYYEFWGHATTDNEPSVSSVERLSTLDVKVPTAFALFPVEIFVPVEYFAEQYFTDIVHWHHMPRGGHFAALEEPLLLAQDLWSMRDSLSITSRSSSTNNVDDFKLYM